MNWPRCRFSCTVIFGSDILKEDIPSGRRRLTFFGLGLPATRTFRYPRDHEPMNIWIVEVRIRKKDIGLSWKKDFNTAFVDCCIVIFGTVGYVHSQRWRSAACCHKYPDAISLFLGQEFPKFLYRFVSKCNHNYLLLRRFVHESSKMRSANISRLYISIITCRLALGKFVISVLS